VFTEQIPIKAKIFEAMPRICYFAKSNKRANLLILYNAQWAIEFYRNNSACPANLISRDPKDFCRHFPGAEPGFWHLNENNSWPIRR
jgi:hypothetical protein